MKNRRGFTLVETLAVVVILIALIMIGLLSYTKYRQRAAEDDLRALHSTVVTNYNNYRKDAILKGDNPESNIIIESSPNDTVRQYISKYLSGLNYNGGYINNKKLTGSQIYLTTKCDVFNNSTYKADVITRATRQGKTPEEIYIIDGTCSVSTSVSNGKVVRSCENKCASSELVCVKIMYDNQILINDYDSSKTYNELCKYITDTSGSGSGSG